MIFRPLGNFVARFWPVLPLVWIGLLAALIAVAPNWQDVITDGDFKFLPAKAESHVGEQVLAAHFSHNFWGSSIMVIARRDAGPDSQLTDDDRHFVDELLAPRIKQIADEAGWTKPRPDGEDALIAEISAPGGPLRDPDVAPLLDSLDGKATLVRISLTTEFTERKNEPIINALRELIDPDVGTLRQERLIPAGLDLYMSGPSVVGMDMRAAAKESATATEKATVILVVVLLIIIYRAPVLALIPLVTVAVAVKIGLSVLAILAEFGAVTLFNGSEIYVTVVMYGAGVDYCMFLMARYKEELDAGETFGDAVSNTIAKIGAPLLASAGTVIVGIGMMVFAEFGKFRQAGVAMSLSLVFVLLASLTFTPALLRMFGKWAFWPRVARERLAEPPGWISPTRFASRLLGRRWLQRGWDALADSIVRRPGTWWVASVAAMVPLAIVGVLYHDRTTYGLLEELPQDRLSVQGARAVQDHFPAGEAGPVAVLVQAPTSVFDESEGIVVARELTNALWDRRDELGIADIRSQADPYGEAHPDPTNPIARGLQQKAARKYYVSDLPADDPGRITRLDVVFTEDPFSRVTMERLDRLEETVPQVLPKELKGSKVYLIGPTASIRDLKHVTNRDQIRIDLMVLAGVYAVLVALLRQIMVAFYLIVTVFFSYLVTLGATIGAFWAVSEGEFAGLDWKVPMFLFTILVAVGEDYNIYLAARVEEEQRRRGGVAGVREGLARTGGIISGCGVIMAGTFCSLMFGSLSGMIQLGFALAFGVILDTFVVRPIVVPAYLVMLNDGRFGAASRWLGAYVPADDDGSGDEGPAGEGEAVDRQSVTAPPA